MESKKEKEFDRKGRRSINIRYCDLVWDALLTNR